MKDEHSPNDRSDAPSESSGQRPKNCSSPQDPFTLENNKYPLTKILRRMPYEPDFDPWKTLTWHKPGDIEKRSMEIIRSELGDRTFPPELEPVILRCIHTSADFDYADNLYFSPEVIARAHDLLKAGANIVTDTRMAWSGISRTTLERFGGQVHCFMSDPDVAEEARHRGSTRAVVCMDRGVRLQNELDTPVIFAVGNAPTALIRLVEWIRNTGFQPGLIIGAPVGFVNVVEAKEMVIETGVPAIVARGRKGGSNVAAAICNALIYEATGRKL